MEEVELFGTFLVSIGLCLMGIHVLSTYVRQIIGTHFRIRAVKSSENIIVNGLFGMIFNAISGNITSLSLTSSSMVSSRLITLKKAFAMMTWGNPASLIIMYLSFLSPMFFVAYLVGFILILLLFQPRPRITHLLGALGGLVIIYYGITVMNKSVLEMNKLLWINDFASYCITTPAIMFLCGMGLRLLIQSSLILALLGIAFSQQGLFPLDCMLVYLYGIFAASSIVWAVRVLFLQEDAKRIALFQTLFSAAMVAFFFLFTYMENVIGIPFVQALAHTVTSDSRLQLANIVMNYYLITAFIFTLAMPFLHSFLVKIFPSVDEKDVEITDTKYINETALSDPESAMDLVESEQFRLIRLLPSYMEFLRQENNTDIKEQITTFHDNFTEISNEIQSFLTKISPRNVSQEAFNHFINLLHRHNTINAIEKNVFHKTLNIMTLRHTAEIDDLLNKFIESLDIILLMINDAISFFDSRDLELLHAVTDSREDLMNEIRKTYLSHESSLSFEKRTKLLEVIVAFEKSIWLTRQLTTLLQEGYRFT
jgi:phosphate:Na+ symporter